MKKNQDSYNSPISFPVLRSVRLPTAHKTARSHRTTVKIAITPLQPQEEKIICEWERLAAQAQRINQIARELEAAILELRAMASTFNSQRRYSLPLEKTYKKICHYFTVSVPWVKQKPDKSFILTTRKVDLFRAEKEAALLAQQLRQQTKK
ncbi:hypothetical protein [Cylindrospermum stagnale]|nr:hypothetical protein [Cylindrospermum stagnale]